MMQNDGIATPIAGLIDCTVANGGDKSLFLPCCGWSRWVVVLGAALGERCSQKLKNVKAKVWGST